MTNFTESRPPHLQKLHPESKTKTNTIDLLPWQCCQVD